MIDDRFKMAIVDFIGSAGEIPNLVGAILFGSAVTGDVSKKSDIDILLLFDCEHNPEVGQELQVAQTIAGEICSKHNIAHSFSFVVVNQSEMGEVEPDFLWNVSKEGIIIWGKPKNILSKEPHPSLEPLLLLSYSVKGLPEKNRRGVFRALYSRSRKRGASLVEKSKEKLGPGTILIPAKKLDAAKKIFSDFGVKKYTIKRLWGH